MALSDAAATVEAAIVTALSGSAVSLFIWWRQTRSPRQRQRIEDAMQRRMDELDDRLRAQYERQIAYLEAQLEKRDRENGGGQRGR